MSKQPIEFELSKTDLVKIDPAFDILLDDATLIIRGTYTPETPSVPYLPNGDPGYPGEPPEAEWEIFSTTGISSAMLLEIETNDLFISYIEERILSDGEHADDYDPRADDSDYGPDYDPSSDPTWGK